MLCSQTAFFTSFNQFKIALLFQAKYTLQRFNHLDFMHGKWSTSVAVVNLLLIDSSLLELFYINKLATHSWPSCLGKQKRNDFQINVPTKFKFVAKGLKFMLFKIQMVCIHIPEKNISLHNQWVSHQGERGGGIRLEKKSKIQLTLISKCTMWRLWM